ncbi:unnamed protein product [Gadus morhua 'NCC']
MRNDVPGSCRRLWDGATQPGPGRGRGRSISCGPRAMQQGRAPYLSLDSSLSRDIAVSTRVAVPQQHEMAIAEEKQKRGITFLYEDDCSLPLHAPSSLRGEAREAADRRGNGSCGVLLRSRAAYWPATGPQWEQGGLGGLGGQGVSEEEVLASWSHKHHLLSSSTADVAVRR